MRRTPRRLFTTLVAAAALLAAIPASAQALSFTSVKAQPANPQAGFHSDFTIDISFSDGDSVKDLTISLPPGEIGDPNATPFCSTADLNADSCPDSTMVGTASTTVKLLGLLTNPLPVTGNVYNVQPHAGEPARFGIALHALPLPKPLSGLILPPVILQSGVQLRQTDFGLDTVVKDIPNSATLIGGTPIAVPISISEMNLTLKGIAPETGKPFLRNPTACTPHSVRFSGDSHAAPTTVFTATAKAFTPTGCASLPFSPSFTAEIGGPGQTTNGVPTTASTAILQGPGEAGLLNAVVRIPSDLNPNASLFFGTHCSQAAFLASSCPGSTVVGQATAASPLLTQPLAGGVSLVDSGGPFPNLGLDLQGQLHLLLQGSISIAGGNTVSFNGLPDIPISRFQLTFTPSPGLIGTSRDICAPPAPVFHADFTGYNGASSSVDAVAKVDGCGGVQGKCKKGHRKHKKKHPRAAEAKKKHKKGACKKKKKKRKKHR